MFGEGGGAILEILGVASEKRGFSNLSKSDQPVWDFIHFEKTRPRTLPHLMSLIWVFYQICFCHPSKPCPPIWGSRHFLNNEFSDPAKPYRPHLDFLTFSKTKFSDCFESYQPHSDCVHFQKKRIPGPSKPCQPHVDLTRCQKKISFWFLPNRMNSMWILLRFGNMDFRKFPKNLSPSRISYVFPKMISWIVPKFISPTQDFVVSRLECVFRDLGGVKR